MSDVPDDYYIPLDLPCRHCGRTIETCQETPPCCHECYHATDTIAVTYHGPPDDDR